MEKMNIKSWLKRWDGKSIFQPDKLLLNLPFVLFCSLLAIVYIGNTHMAEKKMRHLNTLQPKLKELRWEYMTTKAELMYKSKQTEVAKEVAPYGLKKIQSPPYKIIVRGNEY